MQSSIQNCTIDFEDRFYNLSSLYKNNDKYVIKDKDENIEYVFNVCGPIFDDDIPCNDKNVIFMKHTNETDVSKRYVSFSLSCLFWFEVKI